MAFLTASLENPDVILRAQLSKLKGEKVAELKAAGVEYEERMAILETLEHPKPLRDLTYDLFDAYRRQHPWIEDHNIEPKSVARDMYERVMTFADYVRHYELARSEGSCCGTSPTPTRAWCRRCRSRPRPTTSTTSPSGCGRRCARPTRACSTSGSACATAPSASPPTWPPTTRLPRSQTTARVFRLMVRNEAFRRVEALARHAYYLFEDDAAEVAARLAPYWAVHDCIGIDADARSAALLAIDETDAATWRVRQVLRDPAGDHDWALVLEIDLAASDEAGHQIVGAVSISDDPVRL